MPTRVISTANAAHYTWGGPDENQCDAWYLMKSDGLTIIEELMPPGAAEVRHYHAKARQLFFVLAGRLTLEVEDQDLVAKPGEAIEVAPGQRHQAKNLGDTQLRILVTSQPPSHGDRFPV